MEQEKFETLEVYDDELGYKMKKIVRKKKYDNSISSIFIIIILIVFIVSIIVLRYYFKSIQPKNIEKEKKNVIFLVQDISSTMKEAYKKIEVKRSEVNIDSFLDFIEFYSYFDRIDIYTILLGTKSGQLYDSFSLLEEIKSIEKNDIKKRVDEYWKESKYNIYSNPDKIIKDKLLSYNINIDEFLNQIDFKKKQVLSYYLNKDDEDDLNNKLYQNLKEQNKNIKEYPFYKFWHWFDEKYKFQFPDELFIDDIKIDILELIIQEKIYLKNHINLERHSLKNIYNLANSIKGKITKNEQDYFNFKNIMSIFQDFLYGESNFTKDLDKIKDIIIPLKNNYKNKIIILITNGNSFTGTDRKILEQIKEKTDCKVIVFYISSNKIENSNKLFIRAPKGLNKNEKELFKSCSSFESSSFLLNHLKEKNITLENEINSNEGIKLFFQANDKKLMNNFINAINDFFDGTYDFLLNIIGNIELKTYLNNSIDNFKPKDQIYETCYAYASATAIHLSLISREGEEAQLRHPFEVIKNDLISKYGYHGANTEDLLKVELKRYKLKYKEVNESEARMAIKNKYLCVTSFRDKNIISRKYKKFFRDHPKGILTKEELNKIEVGKTTDDNKNFGHAVVLVGASGPLKFLNSWGENWGDSGFFKIDNSKIFKTMKFYKIYWDQADLNLNEIEKNKKARKDLSINYFKNYDKIKDLYNDKSKCELCGQESNNYEFKGTLKKVKCPKCHRSFEPKEAKLKSKIYYDLLIL